MNKADLVKRVARDTGLTKADVLRVLDAVLAQVTRTLRRGDEVKLVDFGTFLVSRRRARVGHQPAHAVELLVAGEDQEAPAGLAPPVVFLFHLVD